MSIIHATTPTSQTQHTCSSDGWAFWSSAQKTVSHPLARADRGAHPLARCALLLPCAKNTLVYCHQLRRLSQKECQRQSYLRLLHFLKLRLKVFRISIVLISVTADATKKRRRKLECVCFCLLFNCWLLFPNNNTFFLIIWKSRQCKQRKGKIKVDEAQPTPQNGPQCHLQIKDPNNKTLDANGELAPPGMMFSLHITFKYFKSPWQNW